MIILKIYSFTVNSASYVTPPPRSTSSFCSLCIVACAPASLPSARSPSWNVALSSGVSSPSSTCSPISRSCRFSIANAVWTCSRTLRYSCIPPCSGRSGRVVRLMMMINILLMASLRVWIATLAPLSISIAMSTLLQAMMVVWPKGLAPSWWWSSVSRRRV